MYMSEFWDVDFVVHSNNSRVIYLIIIEESSIGVGT